ncbi:hypothetical protein C8240_02025 [Paracidovorax cattleyae]|nr:hypothetical protein C8240_02025 [Paracidovorax cattleyae]
MGLESVREARSRAGHAAEPQNHPELTSLAIIDAEEVGSYFVAAAKYFTDPLHGVAEKANEFATEGLHGHGGEGAEGSGPAEGAQGHPSAHEPPAAGEHGSGAEGAHGHGAAAEAAEHHGRMHAFAEEGTPGGVSDLAATLGLAGAMLPLSAVAIHAGYRELREVAEQRRELREQKEHLVQQREVLAPLLARGRAPVAGHVQSHAIGQAIDDLAYQQHLNRHDGRVAAATLTSASLVFAKTAVETSVHTGLAIGAGSANAAGLVAHSAAAAGAASAASIAGGYVLGPAASVMASVVGGVFLHQSHVEKKRFRADFSRVSAFLAGVDTRRLGVDAQRYHDFLTAKFDQRKRFVNGFNNWNKGFVLGGVTYTASTAAKVGLGIAAIAGASVAGPVGLATLIGAGLLGAVTMGVGSHQFFLTHGKVKRYRNYERTDAPGIDRAFLAMADLLRAAAPPRFHSARSELSADFHSARSYLELELEPAPDEAALSAEPDGAFHSARSALGPAPSAIRPEIGPEPEIQPGIEGGPAAPADTVSASAEDAEPLGFLLRSALYAATDGQERALGGFLQQAAEQMNRHYRDKGRSTDDTPPAASSRRHSTGREAKALWRGGVAYSKSLLTGHRPREARQQARQAYTARTDRLNRTALTQWLETPGSGQAQVGYMRSVVELQKDYLEAKLAARQPLQALEDALAHSDAAQVAAVTEPPAARRRRAARNARPPMTPAHLAAELRKARADDEARLARLTALHASLSGQAASAPGSSLLLQSLRQDFLLCETGTAHPAHDTAREFARYCLGHARTHATTVRGTLLATEMQAARVREKAAESQAAPAR